MFSRAASSFAKTSARRMRRGPSSSSTTTNVQRRSMGGGGAAMEGSPPIMHHAAEAFGVIAWLWIFSRARADLPWLLGFRHPWDHVEDPFAPTSSHGHGEAVSDEDMVASWDKFTSRAIKPGEDDDDDDDEDDDDDDDDDDDE